MTAPNQLSSFRVRTLSWANLAKYLRYCRTYGVANATRLAFRKVMRGGALPGAIEPLQLPPLVADDSDRAAPPVVKKISVVIPTRNAGPEFRLLLRKLRAQQGIEHLELIVVDSGSSDDTVTVAKSVGAQVVSIPPESFTHSYARNQGADRATGDYLLFLVQDALPLTQHWLWEMARVLDTTDVVGVSCAEYPRADCDLFYQLLLWNHYRSLQLDRDRILQWDNSCTSPAGLRANAQLSGIAFLIRRDIFQKYRYAGDYAEDLELGIRLIRDGHKIGFLYGTRVLHSHTRPAYYFLKRGYVDVRNLARVLPGFSFPQVFDERRVGEHISGLYDRLGSLSAKLVTAPASVAEYIDRLRKAVTTSSAIHANEPAGDGALGEFVRRLCGSDHVPYDAAGNMILPHVLQHLDLLSEFLTRVYPSVDDTLAAEINRCVIKIFALHSGTHLGYVYVSQTQRGAPTATVQQLDRELASGI
jgi:glycosyltransferase involved in cell wall biosynthesis